jgi:hypothetical protein
MALLSPASPSAQTPHAERWAALCRISSTCTPMPPGLPEPRLDTNALVWPWCAWLRHQPQGSSRATTRRQGARCAPGRPRVIANGADFSQACRVTASAFRDRAAEVPVG